MNDEIVVDVCMAQSETDRQKLIDRSMLHWDERGYDLISNTSGPDKITLTEREFTGSPPTPVHRTVYAKRRRDNAAVLIFKKR